MELPETKPRRRLSLGHLLPSLMLFFLVLDLVFRFVPLDPLTFRAWEAMLRRYPNAQGPFTPGKHYHRDNSYGGVASIGNLPAFRHYHSVDFTTDAEGFHNPPALAQRHPAGVVVGDSFTAASELPEDQSLPAQLTRLSGAYFYNAGSPQPLRLSSLQALVRREGLRHGLVIYQFLESHAIDKPPAATPDGGRGWGQTFFLRRVGATWADRLRTPLNQLHDSPLQGLSIKLQKLLQNDVFLPNSFANFVIPEHLRNGQPILFLPAEFKTPGDASQAAARWAAYFSWYSGELKKDGLDFVVLLVPNRTTIYGTLLAQPRDVSSSRASLDELARNLERRSVPAVNLAPPFARDASVLLDRNTYLYLLDDTHWSACGTAVAAARILSEIAAHKDMLQLPTTGLGEKVLDTLSCSPGPAR